MDLHNFINSINLIVRKFYHFVALAILYLNLRSKPKDESENKEAEEIANLKTG